MARASSWAGCRLVASGRRAMTFLLEMVAALTIGSTGTRPADGLTGIGGRKHAQFGDRTVKLGPADATSRSWSGSRPTSAPPARAWGQAPGGGEQVPLHQPAGDYCRCSEVPSCPWKNPTVPPHRALRRVLDGAPAACSLA